MVLCQRSLDSNVVMGRMAAKCGGRDTWEITEWVPACLREKNMAPDVLRAGGSPWRL